MNDDNFTRDQTFAIAALFRSLSKRQREWRQVQALRSTLAEKVSPEHAEECFNRFKNEAYEQLEGNSSYICRKLQDEIDIAEYFYLKDLESK